MVQIKEDRSRDSLLNDTSRRAHYDTIVISDDESVQTHNDDSSITSKDRGENKLGSLSLTVLTIWYGTIYIFKSIS